MREELVEILACPVCKTELTLTISKKDGEDVLEGALACAKCERSYPVEDGIPNLLPPER